MSRVAIVHPIFARPEDGTGLGPISDLAASAGDGQVDLTWTAASNATYHRPQYRLTGTSSWSNFGSPLGGSANAVTVTPLTNGNAYDFRVLVSDGIGVLESNQDSASPAASGEPTADYIETWPFNSVQYDNGGASPRLYDHAYHSEKTSLYDDTMAMQTGLITPWAPGGGGYGVRRPCVPGYNGVGFYWYPSPYQYQHCCFRVWARWATNWNIATVPEQTFDDKTFFMMPDNPGPTRRRWEMKFKNGEVDCYIDSNPPPGHTGATAIGFIPGGHAGQCDGNWHKIEAEIKRSTTDGIYRMRWDGTPLVNMTFNGQDNLDFTYWEFGANFGTDVTSWMDWGQFELWDGVNNHPGWDFTLP